MDERGEDHVDVYCAVDHNEQAALLSELESADIEAWPSASFGVAVSRDDLAAAEQVLEAWLHPAPREDHTPRVPRLDATMSTPSAGTLVLLAVLVVSLAGHVYYYRERAALDTSSGTVREHWASGELRADHRYPAGARYPNRTRYYSNVGALVYTGYDENADGNLERAVVHGAVDTTYEDRDEDGLQERWSVSLPRGLELVASDDDHDQVYERMELRRDDAVQVRWTDRNADSVYDRAELGGGTARRTVALDSDGDGFMEQIECADGRRFDAVRCEWR